MDRDDSIRRSLRVLEEFHIAGITTTIPFMKAVLKDDDFCNSRITTGFLSEEKMNQLMLGLQVNKEETKITQDIAVLFTFAQDLQKQSTPAQSGNSGNQSMWKHRAGWKWS